MVRLHRDRRPFELLVPRALLAQRYRVQRTFAIVIGAIALVSLVTGGIGIMNVMLTSVVERTREIGLRLTVGARGCDIALQFLTEAVLMTVCGGAVGILAGVGASTAVATIAGWPTHVPPLAVVLASAMSAAVGIVFGLCPAMRAAALDPVDAVHFE